MFSIVIPCYNRTSLLKKLLAGFVVQEGDVPTFEIILVDNNSQEDIDDVYREYSRLLPIYLVQRPQLPNTYAASSARNIGLSLSHFPWVINLDSDCIPNQHYLANLKQFIDECKNDDFLIVGERIFISSDAYSDKDILQNSQILEHMPRIASASNYNLLKDRRFPQLETIEKQEHPWAYMHSGNLIYPKKSALLINGYDEAYDGCWGYEDIDFAYRLLTVASCTPKYLSGIYCYHQEPPLVNENVSVVTDRVNKTTNLNWQRICQRIPGFAEFKKRQFTMLKIELDLSEV